MKSGRAAESAAEFIAARRLADMMNHDESGLGDIAQPHQRLTQSRHGAGVVFILVMSGVERIDDDDLGLNRARGSKEVIQSGGGAEHMAGDAGGGEGIWVRAVGKCHC